MTFSTDTVRQAETVLLVDDEDNILRMLAQYLERKGYRTLQAVSGADALHIVAESAPAAIISDVCMPEMDGLDLLHAVMESDPDTVVILTTGSPSLDVTIEALRSGAVDFLPKPIDLNRLLESLHRGIRRRRARLAGRRRQSELEKQVRLRTRELSEALSGLQEAHRRLQDSYQESIDLLCRTSAVRDRDTGDHIDRIRVFSGEIARTLGLPAEEASVIAAASPMHDIGKIGIPDEILRKPGPLTTEEFEIMKTHTTIGARILSGREADVFRISETIALTHHEQWNGFGYPHGLFGEEIPLCGRIVAVVDVFDALIHERCYKPAYRLEDAIEVMQGMRGTKFDPAVLDAFLVSLPAIRTHLADREAAGLNGSGVYETVP
ncbi:MAG: cyclic di-GMP phosphodiesterase [Candidatus Sumerlaeota bacterium]|nr:cyclic di-GMP phosphodiesterase [Candidatus Sumerlaeota bacterium]